MRYFSIVSVLTTVDSGRHNASLEKQRGGQARMHGAATKLILATLLGCQTALSNRKLKLFYILKAVILPWGVVGLP